MAFKEAFYKMEPGILKQLAAGRHPAIVDVVPYFEWAHLPTHLQDTSKSFATLVAQLLVLLPADSPQLTLSLQKLLEAKDAAVRASLPKTT